MPTPDETKIISIINGDGGESTVGRIARKMRLEPNYVRMMLRSMGENDMVDVFRSGKVRIASKGWTALGKKSERPDGLKRYLEDRAQWKTI